MQSQQRSRQPWGAPELRWSFCADPCWGEGLRPAATALSSHCSGPPWERDVTWGGGTQLPSTQSKLRMRLSGSCQLLTTPGCGLACSLQLGPFWCAVSDLGSTREALGTASLEKNFLAGLMG